jgi:hypothetical protein
MVQFQRQLIPYVLTHDDDSARPQRDGDPDALSCGLEVTGARNPRLDFASGGRPAGGTHRHAGRAV